jgi:hypothetical protein
VRRLFAVLALMPLLAACTVVGSERALFTEADRAAWPIKPGVWALIDPEEKSCRKPTDVRYERWPKCAIPVVIRRDVLILPKGGGTTETVRLAYLLAAGDPMIVQFTAPDDRAPDEPAYAYAALRATKADGSAGLVAFPDCPKDDAPVKDIKTTPKGCLAATAAAVRAVAARPDAETAPAYWVGRER